MTDCIFYRHNRIVILVNERNHLTIYSKIVENNLTQGYGRLCEIHNLIGAKTPFSFQANKGFFVSDPEEIGTGGFSLEIEVNKDRFANKAKFGETAEITVTSLFDQLKENNE